MSYAVKVNFYFTDAAKEKIGDKRFFQLPAPPGPVVLYPSFGDLVSFSGLEPHLFQVAAVEFKYRIDAMDVAYTLDIVTDVQPASERRRASFKLIDGPPKDG